MDFIGLEESNRHAVKDKLNHLPDCRIHYCAADLKKAGFADAAVNTYVGNERPRAALGNAVVISADRLENLAPM